MHIFQKRNLARTQMYLFESIGYPVAVDRVVRGCADVEHKTERSVWFNDANVADLRASFTIRLRKMIVGFGHKQGVSILFG